MKTKRITNLALLTTIALTLFVVEAQIPVLVPIPGMKLGLANIITVYAMFRMGWKDTLCILLIRIFLGNIVTGQLMSLAFSLSGGLFCFGIMLLLVRILTMDQIWICSVIGSVFHVIGQMLMAIFITGAFSILFYLPVLMISAIATGVFTGLCAQSVSKRI